MTHRPSVLFLSYMFPPLQTSGCVRTWNIAKHLSRLGWQVTVVTPQRSHSSPADVDETLEDEVQKNGIRRILTDHRWTILLEDSSRSSVRSLASRASRRIARHLDIDPTVGWLKPAEEACSKLSARDVDVVLASGPPHGAFLLAKRIADRLKRPYVLDYRDPWTGAPLSFRRRRRRTVELERQLLESSSAVTVVSPSWYFALDRRFSVASKLHVVTNGYDQETLLSVKPNDFGHFAIVYTGIFYPPKITITPVMAALNRLKQLNNDCRAWKFHYYGPHVTHVGQEAQRFGVRDRVVLHGRVPRAEALSAVRGAGAAVVIASNPDHTTEDDRGVIPAKTYEPLGLKTPILLVAPPESDVREVVKEDPRSQITTKSDTESMAHFLSNLMQGTSFKNSRATPIYSWTNLAQRMDRILKSVLHMQRPVASIGGKRQDSDCRSSRDK